MRQSRFAIGVAALILAGACEIGNVVVPETTPQIVVHSVLNTTAANQIVFVERTLSGAATLPDQPFNPSDPIASSGGIPLSHATVEIIHPDGRVSVGVEYLSGTQFGDAGIGVYGVPISGQELLVGERYQLRVRAPSGEEVTGFVRIPQVDARSLIDLSRTFNRDHDTLKIDWPAAAWARKYAVRVESPFGPYSLFTDSTRVRMSGDLRNLFGGALQKLFVPGFQQDIFISAVDSNFYDYYRTNNDPFTGTGIINRLTGGVGLFGAVVPMAAGTIDVVADRKEPVEGNYRFLPFSSTGFAPITANITIYVESKPARPGLAAALSGRYVTPDGHRDGILGVKQDSVVTFSLLSNQLAGSKLDTFAGVLRGDTLIGSFEQRLPGNVAYFLRAP